MVNYLESSEMDILKKSVASCCPRICAMCGCLTLGKHGGWCREGMADVRACPPVCVVCRVSSYLLTPLYPACCAVLCCAALRCAVLRHAMLQARGCLCSSNPCGLVRPDSVSDRGRGRDRERADDVYV
jgi:hypothetical protein